MGTLIAIYVHCSDPMTASSFPADYPHAYTEDGCTFYAVEKPIEEWEPSLEELASISERFKTDVIWLSFQSAVEAFMFHHWSAGVYLRGLVYGCYEEERTWDQVYGSTEPWESEAFFDPAELQRLVDYAASDTEKKELRRIWRENDITRGRWDPPVDAREAARKVAEFYRLPGWGLNE
ncbi:MAG: hypothetical protein HY914_02565 [Desulfomonile tiedjei]|nr:hypothetical protein [Desulfomonile tiedjei]